MGILTKICSLFREWDTMTLLRNLKFLTSKSLWLEYLRHKDEAVEMCVFELEELKNQLLPLIPHVLDKAESLNLLETQPKSFTRFGDGEIAIMEGQSIAFQKYDAELARKMRAILKTKRDDLYVGICSYFHAIPFTALEHNRRFHLATITGLRRFVMKETNPEMQYLHASCLIWYVGALRGKACDTVMNRERQLFAGKRIAVVAGKGILDKLSYDVFGLAAEKVIIYAPSKNAFSQYSEIMNKITITVSKDYLVCIILGPTATVMAADLTDMGYMAWDVGHIAKDYDAYMRGCAVTNDMLADFWSPD